MESYRIKRYFLHNLRVPAVVFLGRAFCIHCFMCSVRSLSVNYRNATVSPAITILTMDMSLIRILSDGPDVSLNGSPTVSPTIVALWHSEPLPPK